jgi:hypothetical protein
MLAVCLLERIKPQLIVAARRMSVDLCQRQQSCGAHAMFSRT